MLPCKPIPLQVRIDQVLIASQDIVLLFRLADMIGFYGTMVTSLLGQGAGLSKTVTACHDAATARFYDLVKQQSVAMLQAAGRYPADLLPPRVVQETLSRLVSPASFVRASNLPFFSLAHRPLSCSVIAFVVVCFQNDILVVYSRSMVPTEEREASFGPVRAPTIAEDRRFWRRHEQKGEGCFFPIVLGLWCVD